MLVLKNVASSLLTLRQLNVQQVLPKWLQHQQVRIFNWVHTGHRSSAVQTITQIYEAIESTDEVGTIITKLKQSKIAL